MKLNDSVVFQKFLCVCVCSTSVYCAVSTTQQLQQSSPILSPTVPCSSPTFLPPRSSAQQSRVSPCVPSHLPRSMAPSFTSSLPLSATQSFIITARYLRDGAFALSVITSIVARGHEVMHIHHRLRRRLNPKEHTVKFRVHTKESAHHIQIHNFRVV